MGLDAELLGFVLRLAYSRGYCTLQIPRRSEYTARPRVHTPTLAPTHTAGAWRAWAARLLADDAAFGRLFRPQRCADEIDAAYGVCKASFLCAALQPEVASYAACLRRVRSAAVPPPGWSPAQKRTP